MKIIILVFNGEKLFRLNCQDEIFITRFEWIQNFTITCFEEIL